jgi:DNA integrity scanning protein DisA with diadenylate cyclase activity
VLEAVVKQLEQFILPGVLDPTLGLAIEIARERREGRRIGTICISSTLPI